MALSTIRRGFNDFTHFTHFTPSGGLFLPPGAAYFIQNHVI
jgi:hypothetical protein